MSLGSIAVKAPLRVWFVNKPGGILAAAVESAGPIAISGFVNGRIRGNVHVETEGVLVVKQELVRGGGGLEWAVAQDTTQPGFQYPFDIFNDWPFLTLTWTQGVADTAFFSAMATVMPV